jgi:hypothetical protein
MTPDYLSNLKPDLTPFEIDCGKILGYTYRGNLRSELEAGRIDRASAKSIL